MRRIGLQLTLLSAIAALIVFAPVAQAHLLYPALTPGTTGNPAPNNAALVAPLGTLVASTGKIKVDGCNGAGTTFDPVTGASICSGATEKFVANVEEEVYQEPAVDGGTMDFYYQFQVVSLNKSAGVETVSAADFSTWNLWAGTASNIALPGFAKGTIAAKGIDDSDPAGSTVNFDFVEGNAGKAVTAGQTVFTLVVSTNSTTYQPGTIGLIDSGVGSLDGFEPGPEPASMILLGTVLMGLAFVFRRRLAAK